ncbi:Polyadenylate-binding protein 2 [Apostasia shenzhenica]|uniref:Polyadenylate-binding protein 2 n=1 Tax=Apostasia shenzhenica TaxID=1088818 RepID=A0A2I0AWS9_9ASPA|nr:Polyadenylate-binding protein 2 [Apostasia shenzhenica]
MAEQHASVEADEQVDFDGDNDIEDMIDDEDAGDEDGYRRVRDEYHEDEPHEYNEEHESDGDRHDKLSSPDEINNASSPLKDEDLRSNNEEESQKHAEILALPPHGTEVFIGGLPRDVTDEDLRDLCEPFGEIFEVRLVKDKEKKENKGFAFTVFTTKAAAQKAIEEIQDKEFKGKTLRCSLSQVKHRLFIGNVPKSLGEEELKKTLEEIGPGVENIEFFKDLQNPNRNRGFVFVEYYNNACADYARQKMSKSNFKIDGSTPTVSWADPKNSADASAAAQVKAVYVKNLPENITSEKLKELFERHGEITKVVLPPAKAGQKRDFGFVHFSERSSALKAVKGTEKYEIDGNALEASLAKPQSDKKESHQKPGLLPTYPPYAAPYGYTADLYGAYGGGRYGASGYGQPMIYGRGPMPAGMRMVPMVLPDGRLGYVLQQPGMPPPPPLPPHRRSERGGGSSDGRDRVRDGSRDRRYRPY